MESVRVPQHLELEDVLAFGMGAVDLVLLGASALLAAWFYMRATLAPVELRVVLGFLVLGTGGLLGPARLAGVPIRELGLAALAFLKRPRRRTYAGDA